MVDRSGNTTESSAYPDGASQDSLEWPYAERRRSDRREIPTRFLDSLFRPNRRKAGRRKGETQNIYVDIYARRDVALVVVILLLNILDAYFTLDYLGKGGREANPVADNLLKLGNHYFVYAKCFLVGLCLVFLLVHKTFRYVRVAMTFLMAFYGGLLAYHIYLQVAWRMAHV